MAVPVLRVSLQQYKSTTHFYCSRDTLTVDLRVANSLSQPPQVALVTGVTAVESAKVPLMRPLTPSTVGPSLRQVERQLVEIETQLRNSSSEIAARFRQLQSQGVEPAGDSGETPSAQDQDSISRTSAQDQDSNSGPSTRDRDSNNGTASRTDTEVEGEVCKTEGQPSPPDSENSLKRPATQSGR